MKFTQLLLVTLFMVLVSNCYSQKGLDYTGQENEYKQLFLKFKQYLSSSITNKVNTLDSSVLKQVSLEYFFVNGKLDSANTTSFDPTELNPKQYQNLLEQYRHFYQYFTEKEKIKLVSHLAAVPIRLLADKCIYQKLSVFQKANTFVFFDDRKPDQVLGYLLFVPKVPGKLSSSRIMSSTLLFDSGVWAFKAFTGEIGLEYFLSEGIRAPDPQKIVN